MPDKYSAIYYPDCYVDSGKALMTYLLLYDEFHLIAISDDARNPTERFRTLPDYTFVTNINKGQSQEYSVSKDEIRTAGTLNDIDEQTRRILLFYQFVQRYKPLIGDVIFFHPHVLSSALNRLTDSLLGGTLNLEDFAKFASGEDADMRALTDFQEKYPSIKDEALWRIVPTAMKLAKDRDLVLVSDRTDIPVPILSATDSSVRALTSILAEECIKLLVPSCRLVPADEIMEVRSVLSELLIPFRLSLQLLSKDLRDAIVSGQGVGNVRAEAKFIVESKVEPALYELKKRIEKENSKLLNKVFGKVLSWIPFVAKAYVMPTPDNLLAVAKRVGKDSDALLDAVDDASFARRQGLCFLLQAEEIIADK